MDLLNINIHSSWNTFLTKEMITLIKDIENKIGKNYEPPAHLVLRFLSTDLNNLKLIIYGMDPYKDRYSVGRSFQVGGHASWLQPMRKSLENILKAIYNTYNKSSDKITISKLREEIKNGHFPILPPEDFFNNLETQGVLFLNAALTIGDNIPGSHLDIWMPFTKELIKYISKTKTNTKWFLWGKDAQSFSEYITNNNIYAECHPRLHSFVNTDCFKQTKDIIDWRGKPYN